MTALVETDNAADREIVIARKFDAPRELVFKMFTEPQHVAHWWGPNGFTNTISEMDVTPGGVWRFTMHSPDGVDYPNKIVYIDVVRPSKLVYAHGADIENDPSQFYVTITFDEQDGKTLVTMRSMFDSVEECDRVKAFGAVELGKQTLNRLAEYLAASK